MNIKALIKSKLINKNYYLAKLFYIAWLRANSINKQPIVIYQMGKVGSTSILNSLNKYVQNSPIYQVHVLSEPGISRMEQKYFGESTKIFRKALLPETKHLFTSHFLHAQLKRNKKKWIIVSLVRDPIARNVSEFFYSVDTNKRDPYLPNFYERYHKGTINTAELIERFMKEFNKNSEEYKVSLSWYDTEFIPVTGIDIFSSKFPKEKGYKTYHGKWADVLLIKLERLNDCSAIAFKEFLGIEDFRVVSDNLARQKRYYPAYLDFKQTVSLPRDYLTTIYQSNYVSHFYTADEINSFWYKWHKAKTPIVYKT